MHRALTARWLNRALSIGEVSSASVPVFLCPAIGLSTARRPLPVSSHGSRSALCQQRFNHTETPNNDAPEQASAPILAPLAEPLPTRRLPLMCSGCGAFIQTNDPNVLGFLDPTFKRVQRWVNPEGFVPRHGETQEDHVVDEVLKSLDDGKLEELGLSPEALRSGNMAQELAIAASARETPPLCHRCHSLQHHKTSNVTATMPVFHPTVESLRETIEESPHKYNHIYHVIDAADFPMSLIPRLNVLLGDIPLRTRNRRSRSGKFVKDRRTELSFIITRGDLLGPTKEMVDSMMPYLREVLRDALGRLGGRIRLGNLRCISAKRSWWTTELREEIWERGGAGWLVGKVNVGKSRMFEAVFPKGRMDKGKTPENASVTTYPGVSAESITGGDGQPEVWENVDVGDLLPPPQPAQNYPIMPLVSHHPGTTTSPIRVPFGNGKGELIDLPGMARSDLDKYVKEEHRQSLIMRSRIVPSQVAVKVGQSLILGGGLIRITPRSPDIVFLTYNFTPLFEHATRNEKAIAYQTQTAVLTARNGQESIMAPGAGAFMKHAGTFKLSWDVTRQRAGPLTRKNAVGLDVLRLPFRVVSVDILIEGLGYVELVAQIRAKDLRRRPGGYDPTEETSPRIKAPSDDPFEEVISNRRGTEGPLLARKGQKEWKEYHEWDEDWPQVDVFTPEGRFVDSRQPISGWMHNKPRYLLRHQRGRPRRSMKGAKKLWKEQKRALNDW